jgi:hypothetical protein
MRPHLEKTHHKNELLEWLKVKALSSNPSTGKKVLNVNKFKLINFPFHVLLQSSLKSLHQTQSTENFA